MKKLFTLAMICFIGASMQAKIYYVTVDATTVATTSTISDWTNNPVTLASAISIATTASDSIWVKAGIYYVDRTVGTNTSAIKINSGVKQIFGGFAGTETKLSQRSRTDLDGNGIIEPWEFTNQTIFDGSKMSDCTATVTSLRQIFSTNSPVVTVTAYAIPNKKTVISIEGSANHIIDGIVVQNGKYDGDSNAPGINISVAALVQNCIVRKCNITRVKDLNNGGSISDGAAVRITSPLATVNGCLIEDNTCGPLLPGTYNNAAGVTVSQGTLLNSVIRNNTAYLRCAVGQSGFSAQELIDLPNLGNTGAGLTVPISSSTTAYNGNMQGVGVVMAGLKASQRAPLVQNCIVANNEGIYYDSNSASLSNAGEGISLNNVGVVINCTSVNNKVSCQNLNTTNTLPNQAFEGIGIYSKVAYYASATPKQRPGISSVYNCIALGNSSTSTAVLATKADITFKTNSAYDATENGSAVTASSTLSPFCVMDLKNCIVGGASVNCDQLSSTGTVVGMDNLVSGTITFSSAQKTAVQTVPSNCIFSQTTTSVFNNPTLFAGAAKTSADSIAIKTANWRLKDGSFTASGVVVNTSWANYSATDAIAATYTYASPTTDLLGNPQGTSPIIGALFNVGNGTVTTINKNIVDENATIHMLGNEIKTDVIEPTITVYNTAGLRVKQVTNSNNLSIADLHAGVYIVSAGNGILKFVK